MSFTCRSRAPYLHHGSLLLSLGKGAGWMMGAASDIALLATSAESTAQQGFQHLTLMMVLQQRSTPNMLMGLAALTALYIPDLYVPRTVAYASAGALPARSALSHKCTWAACRSIMLNSVSYRAMSPLCPAAAAARPAQPTHELSALQLLMREKSRGAAHFRAPDSALLS